MAEETSTPNSAADLPSIPTTWPGAFGVYKYSKKAVLLNLGTLVALVLINLLIVIVLAAFLGVIGRVLGNLVGAALDVAIIATLLASVRGQQISYNETLKKLEPMLVVRYIVSAFLQGILLVVSLALLVVPFFFVLPRLMLAPYFLVDKDLDPLEAIKLSWDKTKGHAGMLWGVIGAAFAMALLAVTIIGIPFAIYFLVMYAASTALAYEYITKQ